MGGRKDTMAGEGGAFLIDRGVMAIPSLVDFSWGGIDYDGWDFMISRL